MAWFLGGWMVLSIIVGGLYWAMCAVGARADRHTECMEDERFSS